MSTPSARTPLRAALLAIVTAAAVVPVTVTAATAAPGCGGQRATIVGTARADVLRGTPGNDVIVGLGGRDRIEGRGGSDLICGGGGNDVIRTHASGSSQVWGGGGNDRIVSLGDFEVVRGGGGHDTLRATGDRPLLLGGAGDDVIAGGRDRDDIDAGPGDDRVSGGPGADRIKGGTGNDRIDGGTGADTLDGGDGDDALHGDDGDDRIQAGGGVDVCSGGPGTDFCDGGSPGGPENSPSDPDLCTSDVEHKTSCRDVSAVRPDYLVTIEGRTDRVGVEERSTLTWRMQAPVRMVVTTAGRHLFGSTAATGTYRIDGTMGACAATETGTLDTEDVAVRLWLPESGTGTWDWAWSGPVWFPATWRCAGGSEWEQSVGAYLEDEVGGLPYEPDAGGAWRGAATTEPAEGVTVSYSYVIAPLVS